MVERGAGERGRRGEMRREEERKRVGEQRAATCAAFRSGSMTTSHLNVARSARRATQ